MQHDWSRLDALEEGVKSLETHVRGAIETSLRERQGDLEVHDRRVKRLEAWRDGGDRVLGAEATLERLADADNLLRKEDQSQNARLAAMDKQLAALKAHAQSLQPQRVARCERDAQDALAKAQAASENSDRRFAQQRETLEGIQKKYEAHLTSSKRQVEELQDKFRTTQQYERRVATVETEQNDLRQLIQRHHGELAASQTLAVEKLAKEMRDLERDRRVELDGVRNVAKGALQRTDRVLVELDAVARRVDELHSDVRLEHGRASFQRASSPSHFGGDDKTTTSPPPPSSSSSKRQQAPGSVRTVLARGGGAPSPSTTKSSSDKSDDPLGRSRRVVLSKPKDEVSPFSSPAEKPYKSPFGNPDVTAPAPSPPLPGRSSYTLPDEETLPEPFTKEASPPQTAPKKPYRSPFSPAPAPAAPIDGPAKNSPSNSDNSWDDSESDDGDIAEAPQPAPIDGPAKNSPSNSDNSWDD